MRALNPALERDVVLRTGLGDSAKMAVEEDVALRYFFATQLGNEIESRPGVRD